MLLKIKNKKKLIFHQDFQNLLIIKKIYRNSNNFNHNNKYYPRHNKHSKINNSYNNLYLLDYSCNRKLLGLYKYNKKNPN